MTVKLSEANTVCKKLTDSQKMELVFDCGSTDVSVHCPYMRNVSVRTLELRIQRQFGSGLLRVGYAHTYIVGQLRGCQRCRHYKGEYPKPKERS